jgi:hypothetical protein
LSAVLSEPPTTKRRRLARESMAVAGPVIVVAVVLGLLIVSRFSIYHGNPAGFVLFGRNFVRYTHPPSGAPVKSAFGYDGQFYWIQATDPLLLHRSTIVDLRGAGRGYEFQRMAYPALAFLFAAGQRDALPWALLGVNVFSVLAITVAFAVYLRRRGRSCWWSLAVGLMPGLLMPTLRDLSDTLATASMLGGLLAWYGGRRWWAGGLLALACLSREPMTLAVVAIGVDAVALWWRARHQAGALRRIIGQAWPAVIVPATAYLGWRAYIHVRVGAMASPDTPGFPPFKDFVDEVRTMTAGTITFAAVWDVVYLGLILIGMGEAVWLLLRRVTAAGMTALLTAVSLTVVYFGDQWGDTRYSAPLFAALLLAGLEQRSRAAVRVCVAAASMTLFLPLVIAGV